MSKAFTRESDDAPEPRRAPRPASLPAPSRNYVTTEGLHSLREQLKKLASLHGLPDDPEVQEIPASIRQDWVQLRETLATAIVPPRPDPSDPAIRFGAEVILRRRDGHQAQYRIVGLPETDLDRGWIPWTSPIAKALLGKRAGDRILLPIADDREEWEIITKQNP